MALISKSLDLPINLRQVERRRLASDIFGLGRAACTDWQHPASALVHSDWQLHGRLSARSTRASQVDLGSWITGESPSSRKDTEASGIYPLP
ncbi:hypothetical protein AB1N83_014309 [Pleurotus pulmonarius]